MKRRFLHPMTEFQWKFYLYALSLGFTSEQADDVIHIFGVYGLNPDGTKQYI